MNRRHQILAKKSHSTSTELLLERSEALVQDALDFGSSRSKKKKNSGFKKADNANKSSTQFSRMKGYALPSVAEGIESDINENSTAAQTLLASRGSSRAAHAENTFEAGVLPPLSKGQGPAGHNQHRQDSIFAIDASHGDGFERIPFSDGQSPIISSPSRAMKSVRSAPSLIQNSYKIKRPEPLMGIEDKFLSDFPGIPVLKRKAKSPSSGYDKASTTPDAKSLIDSLGTDTPWNNQRVSEIAGNVNSANTSSGWENQLARHILSMYASTNAAKDNMKSSQAIIQYVDTTTVDPTDSGQRRILVGGPPSRLTTPAESMRAAVEGSSMDSDGKDGSAGIRPTSKSDGKRTMGNSKAAKIVPVTNPTILTKSVNLSEATSSKKNRGISAVVKGASKEIAQLREDISTSVRRYGNCGWRPEEIEGLEEAMQVSSKYRDCITVRGFNGEPVPLRGPPRVFPIWFVSTGDVYADWSVLPEGVKVQAQLKVMYENKEFREYLQLIEALLDRLASDLVAGRTVFLDYTTRTRDSDERAGTEGQGDSGKAASRPGTCTAASSRVQSRQGATVGQRRGSSQGLRLGSSQGHNHMPNNIGTPAAGSRQGHRMVASNTTDAFSLAPPTPGGHATVTESSMEGTGRLVADNGFASNLVTRTSSRQSASRGKVTFADGGDEISPTTQPMVRPFSEQGSSSHPTHRPSEGENVLAQRSKRPSAFTAPAAAVEGLPQFRPFTSPAVVTSAVMDVNSLKSVLRSPTAMGDTSGNFAPPSGLFKMVEDEPMTISSSTTSDEMMLQAMRSPPGSPVRRIRRHVVKGDTFMAAATDNMIDGPNGSSGEDVDFTVSESVDLFNYQWGDESQGLRPVEKNLYSSLGDAEHDQAGFDKDGSDGMAEAAGLNGRDIYGDEDEPEDCVLTKHRLASLWLQLITTSNAMAIVCTEAKRFEDALYILEKSEKWALRDDILTSRQRRNAKAHVHDAFAAYFFRRTRVHAALHHTKLALELHERTGNVECIAVDLLHIAAIECQMSMFKESHKTLYQFLAMVENGRLAKSTASPRQLCLVAVGYHNLAVIQLKLQAPDFACKSSLNARKLARLCLSYSTRYLAALQWTHEVALDDVKFHLQNPGSRNYLKMDRKKLLTILELAEGMFDPQAK